MKRLAALVFVLGAPAALACSPVEVKQSSITRGDACEMAYASPSQTVAAGPVTRLGRHIVRQFVTVGICNGEQIAVYYDCVEKRGVWLGGSYSMMGAFSPPTPFAADGAITLHAGPADYFADTEEPRLAPDYDIDAIAAKAAALPWIAQQGALRQSRITVEGKPFDLSCGCRLPVAP